MCDLNFDRFLMLEPQDMEAFVNLHKEQPLRRQVIRSSTHQIRHILTTRSDILTHYVFFLCVCVCVCLRACTFPDGHHMHRYTEQEYGR